MKTLFEQPLSHRNDPITSYLAAQGYARCGQWRKHCREIMVALIQHDGSTSAELADYMDVDRHIPGRRLSDLRDVYQVVTMGLPRVCHITKRLCVTWFVK